MEGLVATGSGGWPSTISSHGMNSALNTRLEAGAEVQRATGISGL